MTLHSILTHLQYTVPQILFSATFPLLPSICRVNTLPKTLKTATVPSTPPPHYNSNHSSPHRYHILNPSTTLQPFYNLHILYTAPLPTSITTANMPFPPTHSNSKHSLLTHHHSIQLQSFHPPYHSPDFTTAFKKEPNLPRDKG